jgi:anti-sigma factor RsiW
MNTHENEELISAYLDNALSTDEMASVQSHLSSCSSCRSELESLSQAKSLLRRAPRRAAPPELIAAIEESLARPSWLAIFKRFMPEMRVLVPAGALAAVALSLWLRSSLQQPIPIEPLLAAHSRYTAEALVPASELVASNYSAQLNACYGDSQDQE